MADREEDRKPNSPKKDSKSSKVSKESRKSRKHSSSPDSSESSRTSSSSSSPVRKKSRKSKSKKRRSKRSPSTEGSVSCDSNDSELEANKKKHKKLKRSQERKKDKKRKRKKDKSRKKEKKSTLVVNQQKYGKYGILMESDMFNKQQEFYLWLQEVKQINPEVLPRFEMKKMFDSYAEDYNTVTLPHKKFYNLEKWEAKRQEKGRMKAMKKAQKQQVSIETDELRHKSLHSGPTKPGMSREDLLEMQRIMRERQQEDYKKKAGMKVDESKGVRYQAIPP